MLKELKSAYQGVFITTGNIRTLASELLLASKELSAEARHFLGLFAEGTRGFVRMRNKRESGENSDS